MCVLNLVDELVEAEDRIKEYPDPRLAGRFEDHGFIYETNPEDFLRVSAHFRSRLV